MKSRFSGILYKSYGIRKQKVRKTIVCLAKKLEGGEFYSETLRRIFSEFHKIDVGMYSYGCFEVGSIDPLTKIGRYCSFAKGVCIFNGNHPLDFQSIHPFFYSSYCGYVEGDKIDRRWIEIGNDVWVGRNALITPAVRTIGDGAVVGAGSVLTKSVPDYAIVAGNPATIIKYRFSDKIIDELKQSKWWLKDIDEIKGDMEQFTRPFV